MQSCEEQCLEEIAISQKLIKQNKTKKKKKKLRLGILSTETEEETVGWNVFLLLSETEQTARGRFGRPFGR